MVQRAYEKILALKSENPSQVEVFDLLRREGGTESVEQEDDHETVWASSVRIKSESLSLRNHSCPDWLCGSQWMSQRCSVMYYGSREESSSQRREPE